MGRVNKQNLRTPTSEEAREMQKKSVQKRKENILMSQIYKKFIDEHKKELEEMLEKTIKRNDSSSVSLLKELREGTEGSKVQVTGDLNTKLQTTEERLKEFEELIK
jgi:hypothetical protein